MAGNTETGASKTWAAVASVCASASNSMPDHSGTVLSQPAISMNELRLTDTNAADDSAGSVWGLDGNLFMPVVASTALSIGVILILFSFFHVAGWLSFLLGAVPFAFPLAMPHARFQPVFVDDVVDAIVRCLKQPGASRRQTYQLGGPQIYTLREIVGMVAKITGRGRVIVGLPNFAARICGSTAAEACTALRTLPSNASK